MAVKSSETSRAVWGENNPNTISISAREKKALSSRQSYLIRTEAACMKATLKLDEPEAVIETQITHLPAKLVRDHSCKVVSPDCSFVITVAHCNNRKLLMQ